MRLRVLAAAWIAVGCCSCPSRSIRQAQVLRQEAGRLTHPLLDVQQAVEFKEVRPFENELQETIRKAVTRKRAKLVALYYRDMNNGPMIGLDEEQAFTPASLLKVPVMIALLRQAQHDPSVLSRRLPYKKGAFPSVVAETAGRTLEDGKEYPVDELLEAMIADSDNDAAVAVAEVLEKRELDAVFRDLGLWIPGQRSPEDAITVQEYARFFRILYNASYLNREMSEKALGYLARSRYDDGLRAGVPAPVTVAHKFGERQFPETKEQQLHDCGIVYHPERPYILCVMTRGERESDLSSVIRELSGLVWRRVDGKPLRP